MMKADERRKLPIFLSFLTGFTPLPVSIFFYDTSLPVFPIVDVVFRSVRPRARATMMKYTIKRQRLPKARFDQAYTLTIYLGQLGDRSTTREAKMQYPVVNHREGLCKYREIRRFQRLLDEQSASLSRSNPLAVQSKMAVTSKPPNASSKRPQADQGMPVAV